jgi:hypothetical protein
VKVSPSLQQVNWQAVANKKQQDLKEAARGETLKRIREEQQFEIYKAKGKRLETESISLSKRVSIEV